MKKLFLLVLMMTIMSLKGWADNQGYAIFDESTGVLTFKYGEKPEGENVYDTDTPIDDDRVSFWLEDSWFSKRGDIKKVIIEESFENVRPVSTHSWFYCQYELEEIVGLNHINGSNLVCMKRMFGDCSKLTNLDLSGLNTDHVTDMSSLFEKCKSLTSLNLSGLNTENVTNMNAMFWACEKLPSIDLSGFKTDKVTDMSQMFDACNCLQEIDLSTFNTENVTDMSYMFAFCNLTSLDLRSFNTANVTTMEGMFMMCQELTDLDISSFRTDKAENLSSMFSSCKKLTSLDLSHFNTENVTTMFALFASCAKLQNLDISSFNTKKVTNMCEMFSHCSSMITFDLHHFDTSNVTDFEGMFSYCNDIENIDLSNFDTRNMTKITSLFDHCSKLTEMDLTNFDTRNLTEFGYVFQSCSKLEIVKFGENFSTAKVSGKYVNWGFQNCFELKEIWINGDVPELLSTTFGRVGDFGTVILRVPEQYKQNYADHFVDGTFGGGSFVLDVLSDNGSESSIPPSIPDFGTKRLKKITWTDGKETEMAELRYDDTGRIKEYLIDGKIINQYTYSDNTISISENGDSYEYNISDGRVASGKTILDGDNVEIDRTFIYNNQAQLISIVNKEREMGNPGTNVISEKWEWSGDNLTSWSEDAWGDTETSSITYNDITAEPMVRALFGFSQARHLDDFYEILAIYPYLGSIPKNLFQTVKHKDAEKRDFEYNYTYEQKSNGEIGKVSISYKDKTYVFTLDWEDSGASEKDPSEDVIKITSAGQSTWCSKYNLDFTGVDGLKAYIATGFDKDEEIIWLTRVKDVPAGTPVLVKGEANQTYQVPVTDSKNSYYENLFKGNTSGATIQVNETEGDKVNYYLSGDGTFKSVKGYANIGNNKSYLQLPGTFAPAEAGATQTVTIKTSGKASYAAPVDLDFTNVEGLKAFTATGYDKSSKTIWLTRVMKVQKGEGVLLKGDAKDYEIPSVAVQSSYMNMFVGNTSGASVQVQETSTDGSKTNFYLKGDGTFVSVNGYVNIGNNKCYLELPTDMVAGAASTRGAEANYILEEPEVIKLPISFRSIGNDGDGTTAIRETKQLRDDGAYYTLQGQRVVNPGKGLYIKNGKKIVIK